MILHLSSLPRQTPLSQWSPAVLNHLLSLSLVSGHTPWDLAVTCSKLEQEQGTPIILASLTKHVIDCVPNKYVYLLKCCVFIATYTSCYIMVQFILLSLVNVHTHQGSDLLTKCSTISLVTSTTTHPRVVSYSSSTPPPLSCTGQTNVVTDYSIYVCRPRGGRWDYSGVSSSTDVMPCNWPWPALVHFTRQLQVNNNYD